MCYMAIRDLYGIVYCGCNGDSGNEITDKIECAQERERTRLLSPACVLPNAHNDWGRAEAKARSRNLV